jgi:hypothetical protein
VFGKCPDVVFIRQLTFTEFGRRDAHDF